MDVLNIINTTVSSSFLPSITRPSLFGPLSSLGHFQKPPNLNLLELSQPFRPALFKLECASVSPRDYAKMLVLIQQVWHGPRILHF